jgi:hypothetical protein
LCQAVYVYWYFFNDRCYLHGCLAIKWHYIPLASVLVRFELQQVMSAVVYMCKYLCFLWTFFDRVSLFIYLCVHFLLLYIATLLLACEYSKYVLQYCISSACYNCVKWYWHTLHWGTLQCAVCRQMYCVAGWVTTVLCIILHHKSLVWKGCLVTFWHLITVKPPFHQQWNDISTHSVYGIDGLFNVWNSNWCVCLYVNLQIWLHIMNISFVSLTCISHCKVCFSKKSFSCWKWNLCSNGHTSNWRMCASAVSRIPWLTVYIQENKSNKVYVMHILQLLLLCSVLTTYTYLCPIHSCVYIDADCCST